MSYTRNNAIGSHEEAEGLCSVVVDANIEALGCKEMGPDQGTGDGNTVAWHNKG